MFILCVERLPSVIKKAKASGSLHNVQVSKGVPKITHLLFADDSFFFFCISLIECSVLKSLVIQYEEDLGQAINFSKSKISFNYNVEDSLQVAIKVKLGVVNRLNTGRYIGLPC